MQNFKTNKQIDLNMANKFHTGFTPWVDGHYICKERTYWNTTGTLLVQGESLTLEGPMIKEGDPLSKGIWKSGEFGEADPEVVEATGNTINNWSMEAHGGRKNYQGVLSEDGKKATFINETKKIDSYEWMSKEDFAAFENTGDPAEAPPSHYKLQPEYQGKFLIISGPPGLGKSTTGLLLSKMAGYVYYEADCFERCNNPYIPPDTKEPSLQSLKQTKLVGISQERKDAISGAMKDLFALLNGQDFSLDPLRNYFAALCEDLLKERKRLGGDWVVAEAVPLRVLRDFIRAQLGSQLVFVVLSMEKEDQRKRILARHGESNALLEKAFDIFEPAADDEHNTFNLEVSPDMTREQVVGKVLEIVKQSEAIGI